MYEILKGVSMKSVLSWLIKNFCKPIVLKTLSIIILLFVFINISLYNLGSKAKAMANSPVHPDDLKQIDECQLRMLRREKGLITYDSIKDATQKCNDKEKNDLDYQQMIIQKKIIDERLKEIRENTKKESKEKI